MGNTKSKSISTTKSITDVTFDSLLRITNSINSKITGTQDMKLTNIKTFGCNFEANQKMSSEMKQVQEIDNETKTEIINDIADQLDEKLTAKLKAENGFLSTGQTEVKNEMRSAFIAVMDAAIDIKKTNELIGRIDNKQKMEAEDLILDPCGIKVAGELGISGPEILIACKDKEGKLPDCVFNQDLMITLVAEQMAKDISVAANNNKKLTELSKKLDSETESSNVGVGGAFAKMFDSIFAGLSGPMKYGIIASVICVCVLVMAFAFLGQTNAGQNAIRTGANAVAARAGKF